MPDPNEAMLGRQGWACSTPTQLDKHSRPSSHSAHILQNLSRILASRSVDLVLGEKCVGLCGLRASHSNVLPSPHLWGWPPSPPRLQPPSLWLACCGHFTEMKSYNTWILNAALFTERNVFKVHPRCWSLIPLQG